VSKEIKKISQNRAALVEKMIQVLFALTPEWEARRIKALAVSIHLLHLVVDYSLSLDLLTVQSQPCKCESTLDQFVFDKKI